MKKLLAVFMALSMLFSAGAAVIAAETTEPIYANTYLASSPFFSVNTDASTDNYNPGSVINVVLSVRDIVLEEGNGISSVCLCLCYDTEKVTPNVFAVEDSDGDKMSFAALMTSAPDAWEAIGKLDEENGVYDLAFAEYSAKNLLTADDDLVITIPFTVKEGVKVDDIVFTVSDFTAYDKDLALNATVAVEDVVVSYALQPESLTTLPEDAFALTYAGYIHAAENVIYYAEEEITVGDYIRSYIEITNNQQDMNYFGIMIVDANNVITYVDTVIGRPASDKSAVVIPAGSYIVGVNGNRSADLAAFKQAAYVGSTVTLYNVNIEATGAVATGTALTNAGFTITSAAPIVKSDALLTYDEANSVIKVYTNKLDVADFKAMFENDVTVLDKDGNELTSGFVTTGMTVDCGAGIKILVMGDVDCNGEVNLYDYIMLKRFLMKTYTLTGDAYEAACISGDDEPVVIDYIIIKRHCMKTIDISAYLPK